MFVSRIIRVLHHTPKGEFFISQIKKRQSIMTIL